MNSRLLLAILSLVCAQVSSEFYTSVWCHGSHQSHRHCSFRNLCYSSSVKQFLFFHSTKHSVVSGIDSPAEQIRLARMSSLEGLEDNLDDLYMDYAMLPDNLSQNFNVHIEEDHTLIIKRWNAEQIHNVIHDDLIPLYFTMKYLCYGNVTECLEKYQIVISDAKGKHSPYEDLYAKLFHPAKIVYLRDQADTGKKNLICYKKLSVGLETETLWYDYGFYLNGKEGSRENPNLRASYLEEFRTFALEKLGRHTEKKTDVLLILPEVKSRLLNFEDVSKSVRRLSSRVIGEDAVVEVFQFSKSSVEDLIVKASSAKLLVGLTETSMIASLFLPKESAIVEMFPFGLGPDVSPFIQTLASLRGQVYHSWVNHFKSNSVAHPENEPALGGLMHVDKKIRKAIEMMDHVGDIKCCNDPAFLHKFYQDTTVDIPSFEQSIMMALEDLAGWEDTADQSVTEWMLPSKIYDSSCTLEKPDQNSGGKNIVAQVRWQKPLNLEHIRHKSVIYEIVVQADMYGDSTGTELIGEYSTQDTQVSFDIPKAKLRKYRDVKVWVAVVLDHDIRGSDTLVNCNLDSDILI